MHLFIIIRCCQGKRSPILVEIPSMWNPVPFYVQLLYTLHPQQKLFPVLKGVLCVK